MPQALTPRQQRFVEEYLVDLNATAAAGRSGYSDPSIGRQLITKPHVAAAIQEAQRERSLRTQITADRVLQEWAALGFGDIGQILHFGEGALPRFRPAQQISEAARRTISKIKVKRVMQGTGDDAVPVDVVEFGLWDKTRALEQIARHLGMFNDSMLLKTKPETAEEMEDDELHRIVRKGRPDASPGSSGDPTPPSSPPES